MRSGTRFGTPKRSSTSYTIIFIKVIRLAAWTVFDSDFPIGLSLVPRAHSSVLGQRAWPQKLNHEMGKAREQRNLYLGNGLSCPLPVIASRIAIPRDPSASCSRRPARYFLGCRDWGRETQAEGDLQVVSVVVLAALSYLLLELTAFVLKSLWAPLFPKIVPRNAHFDKDDSPGKVVRDCHGSSLLSFILKHLGYTRIEQGVT